MKLKITYAILLLFIAIVFTSCDSCPTGNPENIISEQEAIVMKSLFLEMDKGAANGDYTDVTFSLEDVQKYLHKMSQLGKDQGQENLGLRVHFARKVENGVAKRTVFLETVAPLVDLNPTELLNYSNWETFPGTSYYNMGDGGNDPDPSDEGNNGGDGGEGKGGK